MCPLSLRAVYHNRKTARALTRQSKCAHKPSEITVLTMKQQLINLIYIICVCPESTCATAYRLTAVRAAVASLPDCLVAWRVLHNCVGTSCLIISLGPFWITSVSTPFFPLCPSLFYSFRFFVSLLLLPSLCPQGVSLLLGVFPETFIILYNWNTRVIRNFAQRGVICFS